MSRKVNSFGYRLGITHFWKLQRGSDLTLKSYNNLFKLNLSQIVKTSFNFKGYRSLLCSVDDKWNSIVINIYILKSLYFEKKTKELFLNVLKKKSFLFLFFERLLKLKYFYLLLSKVFYLYTILIKSLINNKIVYTFLSFFISLSFNLISDNLIKFSGSKLISVKKDFFSIYMLKWISKDIEYSLLKLVKKKVVIRCNFVYNLFKYYDKNNFSRLNLGLVRFWMIKRNFKFFESIYFSCYFYLSESLVNILIENLSRKKKTHFRFIYFFFGYVELLYYQSLLNISGIKITIFGKLNARMRKRSASLLLGKVWLSTLLSEVSYNQQHHETRFGVLGVRIWLSKGL